MQNQADKPAVDKAEEVSLIMALGRLESTVAMTGPPGPQAMLSERFASKIAYLVFKLDDDFRKSYDLVELKAGIWYIRTLATVFDKAIRQMPEGAKLGQGFLRAFGHNMEGAYKYQYLPYAHDLTWSWGRRPSEGEYTPGDRWPDLHEGFEEVNVAADITDILGDTNMYQ